MIKFLSLPVIFSLLLNRTVWDFSLPIWHCDFVVFSALEYKLGDTAHRIGTSLWVFLAVVSQTDHHKDCNMFEPQSSHFFKHAIVER